jgi:D-threo-aldose 1-dehydrogenase
VNPLETRTLGRTGLDLGLLGFGAAPIGNLYTAVAEEEADSTLETAWRAGIRYFDTAPHYGAGLSEHRVGRLLRQGRRQDAVISTKVGRVLRAPSDRAHIESEEFWAGMLPFEQVFDYGYDGVMRSYEDSLQRLGVDRIDLLVIHDLDQHGGEDFDRHWRRLTSGGWRALEELRSSGALRGIGAGINQHGLVGRFLKAFDLDFILLAGRYSLLDQDSLDLELSMCREREVGIVLGGVFNSGILARGAVPGAKYEYADAPPAVLARVQRIEAVCARHGVPLAAAAIQFPCGHPAVTTVICGLRSAMEVDQAIANMERSIPDVLWSELEAEGLLKAGAPHPLT